ncbi:MAG TPA: lysophospholipid acyltransferase family protein [Gemmataceae bacterium]|nr:lysophospholipid acyltransferase family protein [Gemmataceae bacterium]
MKIRSPWLIRTIALAAAWLMRAWMATVRVRFVFLGGRRHPPDPRLERFIYVFWHENGLFAATLDARIHALISTHSDGELMAHIAGHLGRRAVRGSTTRGGMRALREMMRVRRTHLGLAPDGPQGPRRHAQMGSIFLAAQIGLPIVAFGVGYSRAWRARSWDRFAVPWPGTCITVVVAPELRVPPGLSRPQMEQYRRLLEEQLNHVSSVADQYSSGRPPIPIPNPSAAA